MAEKEYIEREALLDRIRGTGYAEPIKSNLLAMAVTIRAADVRPVVLCRDCVYLSHDKHGAWCFNNYEANLKDDDFCSYGKRKERLT